MAAEARSGTRQLALPNHLTTALAVFVKGVEHVVGGRDVLVLNVPLGRLVVAFADKDRRPIVLTVNRPTKDEAVVDFLYVNLSQKDQYVLVEASFESQTVQKYTVIRAYSNRNAFSVCLDNPDIHYSHPFLPVPKAPDDGRRVMTLVLVPQEASSAQRDLCINQALVQSRCTMPR